jgi:cystathionine gamma-synthase
VLVAAGRPADEPGQPLNVPIVMASNFQAGDSGETGGRQYSRGDGTPGWQALEEVLGELAGELNMPGRDPVHQHGSARPTRG